MARSRNFPRLPQLLLLLAALAAGPAVAQSQEFCWKDSYGRGAGTVPDTCSSHRERIGLLCYTPCPSGTRRAGVDCHSVCPAGLRDDGLFCRAAEYGRGAGYPWQPADGLTDQGMFHRCEAENGKGDCEKSGAIVYPKCKAGYEAFGCCICRPKTPNCAALGLKPGIDLSCAKKVILGDPSPQSCKEGKDEDAGLCYGRCKSGHDGLGPVCWSRAPKGWVECGMGAAKDGATCGSVTFDQVASVGNLALNVATLGASSAATKAAEATRLAKLKRLYREMMRAYKNAKPAIDNALLAKKEAGLVAEAVHTVPPEKATPEDIARVSAEIAAFADPSGVTDTVAAYTYPLCSKYFGAGR